ncbi:BatA domain-containing protein [Rosistilla oblonga]|uniref:BatA domain-containing protein n=1 Tax=Rosistilla oblonga TaxID=2527990 RepID=UPI003A97C183
MGFLNVTLLFGLAAAAIPIALHLLGRREPQRLEFPALRFLTQRIETNRRRMRVRHWSLLLLRVLALAGLALALAQPHVPSARGGTWLSVGIIAVFGMATAAMAAWAFAQQKSLRFVLPLAIAGGLLLLGATVWGAAVAATEKTPIVNSQRPSAVAIVVDNSVRMTYQTDDGSRLEIARQWAGWIVDHYTDTSTLAILDRSVKPTVAAIDLAAARRSIRRLEPLQVVQPLEQQIEAAAAIVANSPFEQRVVYVITDRTAASWNRSATLSLPEGVDLQVIDVGSDVVQNRTLGDVQVASESVARGIPVPVQTQVASVGNFPSGQVSVELRLYDRDPTLPVMRDGKTVFPEAQVIDRQRATIADPARSDITLSLPPLEPGVHHAEIALSETDALPIDNTRYLTIAVNQPPRALLVSNNANERRVIEQALALPGVSGSGSVDYDVDGIAMSDLLQTTLSDYRVIGLLDPPRLSTAQQDLLTAWTQQGGKLWVSLGPAWEEQEEQTDDDPLIGRVVRQWRVPEPGHWIDTQGSGHPALRPFAAVADNVPWQLYPIYRYWQIDRQESDVVIARYTDTQHPAMIDRAIGAGRLLMFTTPLPGIDGPGRRWNELFSTSEEYWPAFLLVRGAFDYLADRDPGTLNVRVGQPVGLKTADGAPHRYQLFAGSAAPVVVESSGSQVAPGPAAVAGNYWLRSSGETLGYSVNLAPAETDLQRISTDDLTAILGADRYKLVTEREQIDWSATTGSNAQPFYAQMMLLVCGVFVLEQILANRFYAAK